MKWPWTRQRPDPEWEQRLARLEGRLKSIEVEWDEWFDKYRRLYARLAKRVQRERQDEDDGFQDAPGSTIVPTPRVQYPPQTAHLADRFRRR